MSLIFETARPVTASQPERADVACFVGFVARRRGVALPPAVRDQLAAAGWVNGPWRRSEAGLESLDDLPVVIDSWTLFDRLFAWDQRPLGQVPDPVTGELAYCATYLGAAVRDFFAHGGKRAILVRVGDPFPYLESASNRAARRRNRLHQLLPDLAGGTGATPFTPTDPRAWRGMHHLYGLAEASMLCLPDLPDICAGEPAPPPTLLPVLPEEEGFVTCGGVEAELQADAGLRNLGAPRLDGSDYGPWRVAVAAARAFLANYRRDVIFVGALPLAQQDARRPSSAGGVHAQADMLAFLRRAGVFETAGQYQAGDLSAASAFTQLAFPWLRTRDAADLPEQLAPPDGTLAGLLAANALARGTFHSAAGDFAQRRLVDLAHAEPIPGWGAGPDSPDAQLARRVCLFAPLPGGWSLVSDVTTSADEAWRFGGASRLIGVILRTARARGEAILFEANGPQLWTRLRRGLEELLAAFWQAGALVGASAAEAFSVRCGPDTMTQNDLDNGRVITEITVRPALSVERITVVLALANSGLATGEIRSAA